MATLRKRGDRWHCQVRKKGFEPQTKSFRTRAEAERWARLVESEMDGGAFVSRKEAESTTLLEAIDRYEREVTPKKRGAVQERSSLNALRRTTLAQRYLSSIRSGDAAELRDAWLQEGYKPATRSRCCDRCWAKRRLMTAEGLHRLPNGRLARYCGIVTLRQPPDTAGGTIFVNLEDETGDVQVIVWKALRGRQRAELLRSRLMAVHGTWQREGDVTNLTAARLEDLTPSGRLSTTSRNFHWQRGTYGVQAKEQALAWP